jgi:ATP-dependent DNA helicase PIF1
LVGFWHGEDSAKGAGRVGRENHGSCRTKGSDLGTVLSLAHMGIAATQIGGQTICSTFKIPASVDGRSSEHTGVKPFNDNVFRNKDINPEDICLIIIDEVSMITATMIAYIDDRLRYSLHSTQPFGGIPIIFIGDFSQLPPVGGTPIPKSVLHSILWKKYRS